MFGLSLCWGFAQYIHRCFYLFFHMCFYLTGSSSSYILLHCKNWLMGVRFIIQFFSLAMCCVFPHTAFSFGLNGNGSTTTEIPEKVDCYYIDPSTAIAPKTLIIRKLIHRSNRNTNVLNIAYFKINFSVLGTRNIVAQHIMQHALKSKIN